MSEDNTSNRGLVANCRLTNKGTSSKCCGKASGRAGSDGNQDISQGDEQGFTSMP